MALPDWMIRRDVNITPYESYVPRPGKISFGESSMGYDLRIGYKFYVFTPARCTVVDPKNFDKNAFVEVDITPGSHVWKEDGENVLGNPTYVCQRCGGSTPKPANTEPTCVPADHVLIPPNSFVLGETVETVEIPRDCIGVITGKSTYARCGIGLVTTPIEPLWKGKVVIEIANHTPLPAKVYAGEGIGQLLVFRSDGYREAIIESLQRDVLNPFPGSTSQAAGVRFQERLKQSTCEKSYADKKQGGKPGRYQNQTGITLPKVD